VPVRRVLTSRGRLRFLPCSKNNGRVNPVDFLPFVRDQGERNTCLSIALTDGHQIARRSGPTLSAEYLHFCASRRAGVGLNDAVSLSAGCTALAADGQPAEEACPYSAVLRATDWQLPSGINFLWRRNTMVLSGVAAGSLRESLNLGRVCVVILRINDPFILGNSDMASSMIFTVRTGLHTRYLLSKSQSVPPLS
jgi:hypothetical protein